jgi:ribonuclease D
MEVLEGDLTEAWAYHFITHPFVACDIETSGLDKQKDRIACIQFSNVDLFRGSVMVRNLKNPEYIKRVLESTSVNKVFHYAGFDLYFLMRDYPLLRPRRIRDTQIAAHILDPKKQQFYDPNKQRNSHSLAALAYTLGDVRLDKSTGLSNWFNPELTPEQLNYAEQDVLYLIEIWQRLSMRLADKGLLEETIDACDYIPTQIRLELLGYTNVFGYE